MTKKNGWTSMPRAAQDDVLFDSVKGLISLLNFIIDNRPALGLDKIEQLRNDIALLQKFNDNLTDVSLRKVASQIIIKDNDAFKAMEVVKKLIGKESEQIEKKRGKAI